MRDFRTAERPFCYYGPLPLRKLQRLSQSQYLLPGKGSGTAQGSQIAKDLLGETCPVSGQHYNGARDLFADVPLYPSRGSLCSAQNRLWLPPFSHKREEKCPYRIILSRRPLRKFCVSVIRQNQEYHVINVHDGGLFPLSTSLPEVWDGMRAVGGVNAGSAFRENYFKGISLPCGRRT